MKTDEKVGERLVRKQWTEKWQRRVGGQEGEKGHLRNVRREWNQANWVTKAKNFRPWVGWRHSEEDLLQVWEFSFVIWKTFWWKDEEDRRLESKGWGGVLQFTGRPNNKGHLKTKSRTQRENIETRRGLPKRAIRCSTVVHNSCKLMTRAGSGGQERSEWRGLNGFKINLSRLKSIAEIDWLARKHLHVEGSKMF